MKVDHTYQQSLETCDRESHETVESLRKQMNRFLHRRGVRCESTRDDLISETKLRVIAARRASRSLVKDDNDNPLVWRCLRQSLANEARRSIREPIVYSSDVVALGEHEVPQPSVSRGSAESIHQLLRRIGGDDETLLRRIYFLHECRYEIAAEYDVDSTTIGRRERRALKRLEKIAESLDIEIR